MANQVTGLILGGQPQLFSDVSTAQDVATRLGLSGSYKVKINNQPAEMSSAVADNDFVSFGEKVKGGSNDGTLPC